MVATKNAKKKLKAVENWTEMMSLTFIILWFYSSVTYNLY